MEKTMHIAVIPSAGFSHFLSILQFSKGLVELHPQIHVTCIIHTLGSPPSASKTILETLPPNINSMFLPPVDPNDLPQGVPIVAQIQLAVTHSLSSIRQALKSLTSRTPLLAMVVDSFAVAALELAQEFNILSYIYFPSAATTLCTHFHLLKLDEETSCEYRDMVEPIKVPGCVPFHGKDLYTQAQDRTSQFYKLSLQRYKRFLVAEGIFVNSFLEMERGPIKALTEDGSGKPPVYAVGPIIQTDKGCGNDANAIECLAWLDRQQPCSVLYICFGSGGTLSQEQMTELAYGLELSGHKFLWVVRAPSNTPNATYLDAQNGADPFKFLPFGFLERTKEQGMVIPSWAPQFQVLGHSSIGGFLSHCGWNSTLESVVQGVPLITWPLFAEQRMNGVVLSEGLKVGLRPRVGENGLIEKVEIAKVIKCLMEGEEGKELLKRMKELKEDAIDTLKEDGSSAKTISQLVQRWKTLA